MLKFFRNKMNQKGFTLIELIVVIAILGILAAVAVPRLGGFTRDAKIAADKATFGALNSAILAKAAQGNIIADVTVTTGENGVISGAVDKDDKALLETGAKLQLEANQEKSFTWTIDSDGAVSAQPTISDEGVISADE